MRRRVLPLLFLLLASPAPAAEPPGRFGAGLDARRSRAVAPSRPEYQKPPLTVECWAKLVDSIGFNVLVASSVKESSTHWEIYTTAGSGTFAAYVPGRKPAILDTKAKVTDNRWHYLTMTYEADRVRLFVDAKEVGDFKLSDAGGAAKDGPLVIGGYPPQGIGCAGLVDEVRVSKGVRPIAAVPEGPFTADEQTLGLWHLDAVAAGKFEDVSALKNAAAVEANAPPPQREGPSSETDLDYRPADEGLSVTLIDRSPQESYVAVRADSEGRLFLGGREALFVLEPDGKDGYRPKKELYRFPPDSWISDVEIRGDDLYVLTASALYLLPGGRTRHAGLKPERLVWGIPLDLHVSFHCLAWGPEGDLYFNAGDPLLNYGDYTRPDHWGHWTIYTRPEGTKVPYTGVGGVFRVRPDGSNFRVVAGGLRGCFGLCFNSHWELFTNDNDHESLPDRYTPGRLLHVTPHADFAWPRGWVASKSPDRSDLLEPMMNTPGRGVPIGLAWCDEPGLPAGLLQARWDRLAVLRHPVEPRGASFSAKELPFLIGRHQARPVGLCVADGSIFVTVSYMGGNAHSPKYVSDLIAVGRKGAATAERFDITKLPTEKLWAELSQPSWSRRARAQQELLRRRTQSKTVPGGLTADGPSLIHLPWLLVVNGGEESRKTLALLSRRARPEIQLQAVRAASALKDAPLLEFETALREARPRVQLAALATFFEPSRELPLSEVVKLARGSDTYLRQTSTTLLARRATHDQLLELSQNADSATRLAAVLAMGTRLTVPPADYQPPESLKLTYQSGNAYFTIAYADAKVDLRSLGRVGSFTAAERWKAVPPGPEEAALFDRCVKLLDDPSEPVRLQAAYVLSLLRDPKSEPLVAKVYADARGKRLSDLSPRSVPRVWTVGPFADSTGFDTPHAPERGAIDLSAELTTAAGKRGWKELAANQGQLALDAAAGQSAYLTFRLQSVNRQTALLSLKAPSALRVWHNGRPVGERPASVPPGPAEVVPFDLQPGTNDVLVRVAGGTPTAVTLTYRAPDDVGVALADRLDSATLAARLKEAASGGAATVPAEFLKMDWEKAARSGDAERGRKLFGTLGCVKCHAVTVEQQGGGAPSLTDVGKRFNVAYLVESVLLPDRQVADVFRASQVVPKSGKALVGLVVNETAERMELLLHDTTRVTLTKKDVEERQLLTRSPMPAGLVKMPDELRDLLTYLLSDRPLPP